MKLTSLRPLLLLIAICLLLSPLPAAGEQSNTKRIAFLPFAVHAPADMLYLKEGVRDMLASRLAAGAQVNVIDRAQVEAALEEYGKDIGQDFDKNLADKLEADYLVSGSITAMGGSLSLDAKVFNRENPEKSEHFYTTAPKAEEVIPSIDAMAWNIGEKMFGYKNKTLTEPPAAATAKGASTGTEAVQGESASLQTSHPDRDFLPVKPQIGAAVVVPQAQVQSQAVITPILQPQAAQAIMGVQPVAVARFSKSPNYEMSLLALGVGDVDGDGKNEVLLAEKSKVHVYRRDGLNFSEIGVIAIPSRLKIHALSLADLDSDSRAEIYISAGDNEAPYSYAAKMSGDGFSLFLKDIDWYIKTVDLPGEGLVLAGQTATTDYPLAAGVYRLEVNGDKVKAGQEISLPRGVNLFDFAYADIDGDSTFEIVATDQDDRLRVLDQSGKMLWRSNESFGGVTRFLGGTREEWGTSNSSENKDFRIYVSPTIVVRDLNNDGRQDIIINRNSSSASKIFTNSRSYPDGEITALSWNGIALTPIWSTGKIDGYIADFGFSAGKDATQPIEAMVGVILQGGWLNKLSANESTVLIFPVGEAAASSTK